MNIMCIMSIIIISSSISSSITIMSSSSSSITSRSIRSSVLGGDKDRRCISKRGGGWE